MTDQPRTDEPLVRSGSGADEPVREPAADREAPDAPEVDAGDEVEEHVDRADRLQERLALPVLVAALASVPAVFLTLFDDPAQTIGNVVNGLSGIVLVVEAVLPFLVAEHRLRWLRRNIWLVLLAAVTVPAVIFAVGPVQLLRLLRIMGVMRVVGVVRVLGALRIVRVRRILKAGQILRERAGLDETWQRVVGFGMSLLVAGFVAVVLADPSSQTRQLLDGVLDVTGVVPVLLAGALLGIATLVVVLNRDDEDEGATESESSTSSDAEDRRESAPGAGTPGAS